MPILNPMTPEQRKIARAESAKRYREKHRDRRRESNKKWAAKNKDKIRAKSAAWWKANRDKAAEYYKRWCAENPEKLRDVQRATRKRNATRIKKYNREYGIKNRDKLRVWANAWRAKNPEKYRKSCSDSHKRHPEIGANAKAKRRQREAGQKLSPGLTAKLMILQNGLCNHCKRSLLDATPHRDHIKPLAKGGDNLDYNIQLSCRRCNQCKGAKMPTSLTVSL